MIHQLKTETLYFEDIISGKKQFEVRKADRCFEVGDFLGLNEISRDGEGQMTTGRCCVVEVNYVLTDPRFVKDGYVVLGIRPCAIGTPAVRQIFDPNNDRFYSVPVYGNDKRAEMVELQWQKCQQKS